MITIEICVFVGFFQGLFPPGQGATIGVDFMIKTVEVDGDKVKVSAFIYISRFSYCFYISTKAKTV